jgi:hypothetical protein
MLMQMLADWPFGTLIAFLIVAFCVGLVGFVLWGIFIAIDSCGRPRLERSGVVTGREFIAAHSTMMVVYNPATKLSLPQPVNHPDDWRVSVEVESHRETLSMPQAFFDSVSVGTKVIAKVVRGRLSTRIYIKTLRVDDGSPAHPAR